MNVKGFISMSFNRQGFDWSKCEDLITEGIEVDNDFKLPLENFDRVKHMILISSCVSE